MPSQVIVRYVKWGVAALIVAATFGLFAWYINTHPDVIKTVTSLSLNTLFILTIGYVLTILANAIVLYYSLRLLRSHVPLVENIMLTGYSSIVNFFGPLQSGPGFRAIYLKRMYAIKLRDFLLASVVFYGFFGVMNGAIIGVVGVMRFGKIAALLWGIGGLCLLILAGWLLHKKYPDFISRLRNFASEKSFWMIGLGALLLNMATVFIYHSELTSVYENISLFQSVIYTAAANLALFVSLTPGALGIRESFLILSSQLHNIPTEVIVSASIIDRAFYVLFLLVMFLVLLAMNVKKRLRVKQDSLSK